MVLTVAVALIDGQFVVQIPFRVGREIILIGKGIVADLLDLGILCGINFQAAAVKQGICLSLIIACRDQIFQDIVRQCIYEICIDGGFSILGISGLDAGIYIVRQCLGPLLLCDIPLIVHILKHFLTTNGVVFRVCDGVIAGGILCDSCYDCTFRKIQVADRFVEITHGCCLDAEGVLAQIDGVHVIDQDRVLVHDLFQFQGKILFLDLTFQFFGEGIFGGPVREDVILEQLLGDGAGTFCKLSAFQYILDTYICGTEDTLDINAVVCVETGILDGDKGILQILWNHIDGDGDTVGISGYQLGGLVVLNIIHKSREPGGCHINVTDIWSAGEHTFEDAYPGACTDDSNGDQSQQTYLYQSKTELFPPFCRFRMKCLLLLMDTFFSVIHDTPP